MIPKVNFKVAKIEEYFDILRYFFLGDNLFGIDYSLQFLGLKEILKKSKNKEDSLFVYFKSLESKNKEKLRESLEGVKYEWQKIEKKCFKVLEEINEIKFTNEHKYFTARITMNPVCPRYLDYNMFGIFYKQNLHEKIDTILHELSHFIFFEKFKKIYPKTNREKLEYPHLIWKLSEIMPGIILKDEKIQKIFTNKKLSVYDSIKKLKINNRLILEIFQEFYDNKKDFTDFIKKSYEFMQKHEKEIDKQF